MTKKPKGSSTLDNPLVAKRRRQELDREIRTAFVDFLQDCRNRIEAELLKTELDEDLRHVARLLDKRQKREQSA